MPSLAPALVLALASLLAAPPALFPKFERQSPSGTLSAPRAVAIASDGAIVVADSGRHRIVWLDRATGSVLRSVGGRGGAPGEFLFPSGVAIAPSGELVVADTGNHRVQVLAPDGALRRVLGGPGSSAGFFRSPSGIAASSDRIAVADTGNARVQILAPDGSPIAASASGVFARPAAVALAAGGGVFAADADLHVVVALDAAARESARFGGLGFHRGLMAEPASLALHAGALFVADTRNHRVQAFDSSGAPLGEWGQHAYEPREGEGKLHYPDAVAIAPDGSFAAVAESIEDRIQFFVPAAAGDPAAAAAPAGPSTVTHFGKPIAAAGSAIALVDPERDALVVYDARAAEPVLVGTYANAGFGVGRVTRVTALALAPDGKRLAAIDGGRRLLQVFGLDRDAGAPLRFDPSLFSFVKALDFLSPAAFVAGAAADPSAIARDRLSGHHHVLDARAGCVIVFDAGLRKLGEYGKDLEGATGLALDAAGRTAYVALPLAGRVRALDARTGETRFDVGRPGEADGEFSLPFGVAAASDGTVSVTDSLRHRVQEFDAEGRFLRAFGGPGVGGGEFWKPAGVARDERGRLLVVDYGNHRVQVFSPGRDGGFESAFGARAYVRPTRARAERE